MFKSYIKNRVKKCLSFLYYVGEISILFYETLKSILKSPIKYKNIVYQMFQFGLQSLPIASLIGLFSGMILCIQGAEQLIKFGQKDFIGMIVAKSLTREIGPTVMSVVIAGRIGSAMAAEIGTMKITEQIDALHTMAVNPISYLVVPRFIAAMLMLPILTIFADFIGIFGGYIVSVYQLSLSPSIYINSIKDYLLLKDIFGGLFKATIFGIIIALISCYFGLTTKGGAEGVGKSATEAVVTSAILIIASNYFITTIIYFLL